MAKHGAGKESYRIFQRALNAQIRYIKDAENEGELYTYDEVQGFFGEILELYATELEELRLDFDLWYGRASDYARKRFDEMEDNYPFVDTPYDEEEDTGTPESEIDDNEFPFDLIDSTDCEDRTGKERGIILTSIEEAFEYIQPIPDSVVVGFVPIFDEEGNIIGLHPCLKDDS